MTDVGRLYRGTNLPLAEKTAFAEGYNGKRVLQMEGWMDPEDTPSPSDARGVDVAELPWAEGPPMETEQRVVGGFSERIAVSVNFAAGVFPLLLHLDERGVKGATRVRYTFDHFDAFHGHLAYVAMPDDAAEVRVNGELMGLANPPTDEDPRTIRYWGESLERRSMDFNGELEYVSIHNSGKLDISDGIDAVGSYVQRPKSNLAEMDGYATQFEIDNDDIDATPVDSLSDADARQEYHDRLRERVPDRYPVYTVDINTTLANEVWEIDTAWIDGIIGPDGPTTAANVPGYILGE